ncbi:MAG: hypothetical protein WAQ98_11265 [Blastocatellia bacterium]
MGIDNFIVITYIIFLLFTAYWSYVRITQLRQEKVRIAELGAENSRLKYLLRLCGVEEKEKEGKGNN